MMRSTEIEGPDAGTLEARASVALKVLAFLDMGAVVLALFPPPLEISNLLVVVFQLAETAMAAIFVAVAFSLDRRRPWAVAAVRPLLVVVALAGTWSLVATLAEGRLKVPFDVVLAAWALLGPANERPIPRPGPRSIVAVGGTVALATAVVFAPQVFDWGGLLDVHEPDLRATLAVDCGPAADGPPASLTFRYDWSWARSSPLPNGNDIVVIGWTGADAQGRPLYVIDDMPDTGAGIYSGRSGYPSLEMANEVAGESHGSFRWLVVLGQQQLRPGQVELVMQRPREVPSGPVSLKVSVSYVHLGLWRHDTAPVTCTW